MQKISHILPTLQSRTKTQKQTNMTGILIDKYCAGSLMGMILCFLIPQGYVMHTNGTAYEIGIFINEMIYVMAITMGLIFVSFFPTIIKISYNGLKS